MIVAQSRPPVSWTERSERMRASVTHAADAVAGPLPRRLGAPSRQPTFAAGRLAAQAALWGIALGLLAPATTVLVEVSGLAADGVQVVGSTDVGFFLGFVPLLTALVVTLLALDHWPLHDLRSYHRELAAGLLLVGAVTLVGLRAHGAAVTSDDRDGDWLFANGSLMLHVLVTWCLVRLATNDLTALHARRAGWRPPRATAGIPGRERTSPGTTRTARAVAGSAQGRAPAVAAGARSLPGGTAGAAEAVIPGRHLPTAGTAAAHDAGRSGAAAPRHHAANPTAAGWRAADEPGPDPAAPGAPQRRPTQPATVSRPGRTEARHRGAGAAALAWDAPRRLATAALAFQSVVWGVIVGAAAGAAAGTGMQPGLGTLAGGYLGAIYGLVPAAICAAAVVTVVSWRRDTDPAAVGRAVQATLAAVGAGVLAAAWPFLHAADLPGTATLADASATAPQRAWLLGAVVVVLLLRRAAPRLTATYVRLVG